MEVRRAGGGGQGGVGVTAQEKVQFWWSGRNVPKKVPGRIVVVEYHKGQIQVSLFIATVGLNQLLNRSS